jgi:hypothetical protein
LAEKQAAVVSSKLVEPSTESKQAASRPVFKPTFKKVESAELMKKKEEKSLQPIDNQQVTSDEVPKPKPVFRPTFKR